MPFVKNGGLFIPTNSNYRLGDEVFMLLNLMGEEEKLPVAGRVIWMTNHQIESDTSASPWGRFQKDGVPLIAGSVACVGVFSLRAAMRDAAGRTKTAVG